MTLQSQRYRQVGRYCTFAYATLAGRYGDDIFYLRQQLVWFRTGRLLGVNRDITLDVHFFSYVSKDSRLGSFYHRFDKRIVRFFKKEREAYFVTVDPDIIFYHTHCHKVFSCAGVTHLCQCVHD